jgi:hypothetical protein
MCLSRVLCTIGYSHHSPQLTAIIMQWPFVALYDSKSVGSFFADFWLMR